MNTVLCHLQIFYIYCNYYFHSAHCSSFQFSINDYHKLHKNVLPIKTPRASNRMNGLLLPYFSLHLSLRLPKIGVTKKPMRGLSAQTRVIC